MFICCIFCWFIGHCWLVFSFLPPSHLHLSPFSFCVYLLLSTSLSSFPFETELCYVAQAGLEQVILLPSLSSTNATVLALFSLRIHILDSGDIAQWSSTCLAYLMTPETFSVPRKNQSKWKQSSLSLYICVLTNCKGDRFSQQMCFSKCQRVGYYPVVCPFTPWSIYASCFHTHFYPSSWCP